MEAPPRGAVVIVLFPFFDLSHTRLRRAVVLVDAGRGDCVLCQITSRRSRRQRARIRTELGLILDAVLASRINAVWTNSAVEAEAEKVHSESADRPFPSYPRFALLGSSTPVERPAGARRRPNHERSFL